MYLGKARNEWDQTCVLWATIRNALRDDKEQPVSAEELNPFRGKSESQVETQSGFVSRLNLIRALPVDKREAAVQALMRRD